MRGLSNNSKKCCPKEGSEFEGDDTCILGSFNTGFSCSMNLVRIQPCPHFKDRADQREVTLREQQLCLKYGRKIQDGPCTIFQLGGISFVQTGSEQGNIAITVIRVNPNSRHQNEPESWIPGETLNGVIVRTHFSCLY